MKLRSVRARTFRSTGSSRRRLALTGKGLFVANYRQFRQILWRQQLVAQILKRIRVEGDQDQAGHDAASQKEHSG